MIWSDIASLINVAYKIDYLTSEYDVFFSQIHVSPVLSQCSGGILFSVENLACICGHSYIHAMMTS